MKQNLRLVQAFVSLRRNGFGIYLSHWWCVSPLLVARDQNGSDRILIRHIITFSLCFGHGILCTTDDMIMIDGMRGHRQHVIKPNRLWWVSVVAMILQLVETLAPQRKSVFGRLQTFAQLGRAPARPESRKLSYESRSLNVCPPLKRIWDVARM